MGNPRETVILDLHLHTHYSFDSVMPPAKLLRIAKRLSLDGIAITDHGTIAGGVAARKLNRDPEFRVIVGVELHFDVGDLVGLFVDQEIVARDFFEAAEAIRDQGGVVILPHPFRAHKFDAGFPRDVDAIEVFNARTSPNANRKAVLLAHRLRKPGIAVSDAHFSFEIGTARTVFEGDNPRDAILAGPARLEASYSPRILRHASQLVKAFKLQSYRDLTQTLKEAARETIDKP